MAIPTNIIEKDIALASGDEELPALLAHPDSDTPLPAVLMLHDIFGLRQLARGQARRLAGHGVVALYPHCLRGTDPFDPLDDPDALEKATPFLRAITEEQCMRDIEAGLDYLSALPQVDSQRIALWGYCWGGGMVLRGAGRFPQRVAAAVVWHGMVRDDDLALVDTANCPTLGLFGDADHLIPVEEVATLEKRLQAAGARPDFHIYPDAPHSFCDETRPESFNAAACTNAWKEVTRFLREQL